MENKLKRIIQTITYIFREEVDDDMLNVGVDVDEPNRRCYVGVSALFDDKIDTFVINLVKQAGYSAKVETFGGYENTEGSRKLAEIDPYECEGYGTLITIEY